MGGIGRQILKVWQWFLVALKYILPQILRVVWIMSRMILTGVWSFWTGVPAGVRKNVNLWLEQAWSAEIPTEYDSILFWIFTVIAYVMILGGWLGFSYLTVLIVSRIL